MENQKHEIVEKITLENKSTKFVYFLPIIFIILILPLITHGKIIELTIQEADFWKGGLLHVDFFSYYKYIALVIATCFMVVLYSGVFLNKKLKLLNEKIYYIPMCIYALFVLISTMLSSNLNVSLIGFIEMYQGMSVLFCYILLTFIVMNFLKNERDIKIITYTIALLSVIMGLLGLSQYFGHDFFQTPLGQWIITPSDLNGSNLNFSFGKYTIYGTMYNTNFVGSFGALVLPITTALYIYQEDKKKTIIFFLASVLSYTTWLGCNSRAGYVGIAAASIVGIIIFRHVIKEKYKKITLLIISFIIIAIVFDTVSGGRVLGQLSKLNPISEIEKIKNIEKKQKVKFTEISVKDNTFIISTTKEALAGFIKDNILSFRDAEGSLLNTSTDIDGVILFEDEKYKDYSFVKKEGTKVIRATIYNRPLDLYSLQDDTVKVISFNRKLTNPVTAPRIKLFDGRETFASNRGYIWSRTIPMIKDTLFIGYGPDNYCMVFPQEDYVGRFNTGNGMTNSIIDKPHNMYMQIAINTGGISLLALLFMWTIYIVDSVKLYINGRINTFNHYMGVSVFLGIIAYLGAGIFNDNVISVAPLFWVVLGLGIALNNMNKIDKSRFQC